MRVVRSGRFVRPASAPAARRYLEENLLSLHGRASRLSAVAGVVRTRAEESEIDADDVLRIARSVAPAGNDEWLIVHDYDEGVRQRSIVFLFANGEPRTVVKLRRVGAPGEPLQREAEVLRAIRAALDLPVKETLPRVERIEIISGSEVLALSAVRGRPLSILMQRSLRPRIAHAAHLVAAGEWLGRFHAATRNGDNTAVHGDFWPRNVLFVTPSPVAGVVDWEHGSISGPPWQDLFTLPILFATAAPAWRRRKPLAEFARAFTRRSGLADVIRHYFASYAARASVAPATLHGHFEQYLLERVGAGKEESGWQARYPWPAMLELFRASRHSVFSG